MTRTQPRTSRLGTAALLLATSFGFLAIAGAPARADGGGMPCAQHHAAMDPAAHIAKLTPILGLTASQQAAAKKMAQEFSAKAEPLVRLADSQHEEIRTMLDSQSPDPAQVGQKVIAMHGTHARLDALHQQGRARLETLLDAEQRARLAKLHEGGSMHGAHGHAGPDDGE